MKVLVVVAHPDDEILGCGGTIARLIKEDNDIYVLILGEGINSRDSKKDKKSGDEAIIKLRKQAIKAGRILGVRKNFFFNFPDNKFDTIALLDIVKIIEKVKEEIKPEIIFTHYEKDLNIDHQLTYRAVITATRPMAEETVKEIYSFEILSSTEWSYPLSFSPDVFFDISKTLNLKIKAMKEYHFEIRNFPHPRSLKEIRLNSQYWGTRTGVRYAEAFKCVRVIK